MEEAGPDTLRQVASQWSLAGDEQLLNILQTTHQRIITQCKQITDNLDSMVTSLDDASISLQNVNNRFLALSNSQFIESRVYDDDENIPTETSPAKEQLEAPTIGTDIQAIKRSLQILEDAHETLTILHDSDTDTESEDEAPARTVLRPRDMYSDRPLPYIIGSQAWKNKWHAGLVCEDSDSDTNSGSARRSPQQYSDSDPEPEPEPLPPALDRTPTLAASETSSEQPTVQDLPVSATVQQTPADIAAELARRLGGQQFKVPEPEYEPPLPTNKMFYKPQQPTASTIFPDEPPPLDSDSQEDDIFAELHRQQPAPDLFRFPGHPDAGEEYRPEDVFSDFAVDKPVTNPSATKPSTLFADGPDMFVDTPKPVHPSTDTTDNSKGIKKPVGGISLFGTNKGAESIGAAILNRNRRKSSTSGDDGGSDTLETQPPPRPESQVRKEKDIFDDLFARSQKIETGKNKTGVVKDIKGKTRTDIVKDIKVEIEKKKAPETEKKQDLFSDNIFDDIDDIFTTNVVKMPEKEKRPVFQVDDDDLFSEIAAPNVKKPNTKSSDTKQSLFDSDDELFSDVAKDTRGIDKHISNTSDTTKTGKFDESGASNETTKISKEPTKANDIFGDEDDLFANINENVSKNVITTKTGSSSLSKAFKSPSLFDDDDDLFIDTVKPKKNAAVDEIDRVVTTDNIFDDDDGGNLFGSSTKPTNLVKNTTAGDNTEQAVSTKSDFNTKTHATIDKNTNADILVANSSKINIARSSDVLIDSKNVASVVNTNWYKGVQAGKPDVTKDGNIPKNVIKNDLIVNKLLSDENSDFDDNIPTIVKNYQNEIITDEPTDIFDRDIDIFTKNIDNNAINTINKPGNVIQDKSTNKPETTNKLFLDELDDDDELFKTATKSPALVSPTTLSKKNIGTLGSTSEDELFTSLPKTISVDSKSDALCTDTEIPDTESKVENYENSNIFSQKSPQNSDNYLNTPEINNIFTEKSENSGIVNRKHTDIPKDTAQTFENPKKSIIDNDNVVHIPKTIESNGKIYPSDILTKGTDDIEKDPSVIINKTTNDSENSSKKDIPQLDMNKPITDKVVQKTTPKINTDASESSEKELTAEFEANSLIDPPEETNPSENISDNTKKAQPSVFDDIFREPPAFEKPTEPKRSKNINALFDDDSDDEALFFKKDDVISDERPQDFKVSQDKFDIFFDEPPDADVTTLSGADEFNSCPLPPLPGFEQEKDSTIDRNESPDIFRKLPQNVIKFGTDISSEDGLFKLPELSTAQPKQEIIDKTEIPKKEVNSADSSFSNDEYLFKSQSTTTTHVNTEAKSKETTQSDDEDLFKTLPITEKPVLATQQTDIDSKTEESPSKKVGKLKTMNFKINVNALLPGASPKKQKSDDISTDSNVEESKDTDSKNSDSENVDSKLDKMVKSVTFDGEPESGILDNKLSKERARIQVKRRPSTRRARREAVRKSAIDLDDSTDNSSSIDDPPKIHTDSPKIVDKSKDIGKTTTEFDKNIGIHVKNVSESDIVDNPSTSHVKHNSETVKTLVKTQDTVRSVTEGTEYRPRDVKSKIVYILNDEDIFNTTPNPGLSTLGNVYTISTDSQDNKLDLKKVFDQNPDTMKVSGNNQENNKNRNLEAGKSKSDSVKKSIFDSDSGDELFTKREVKKVVKGPLFSDDDDDDLFSVKKKSNDVKPHNSRSTAARQPPKHTEPVFEDPLSIFSDDD